MQSTWFPVWKRLIVWCAFVVFRLFNWIDFNKNWAQVIIFSSSSSPSNAFSSLRQYINFKSNVVWSRKRMSMNNAKTGHANCVCAKQPCPDLLPLVLPRLSWPSNLGERIFYFLKEEIAWVVGRGVYIELINMKICKPLLILLCHHYSNIAILTSAIKYIFLDYLRTFCLFTFLYRFGCALRA